MHNLLTVYIAIIDTLTMLHLVSKRTKIISTHVPLRLNQYPVLKVFFFFVICLLFYQTPHAREVISGMERHVTSHPTDQEHNYV